jgi:hypothetical protein
LRYSMMPLFDIFLFLVRVGHFLVVEILSINFLMESASSTLRLHSVSLMSSSSGLVEFGNIFYS